MTIRVVLCDDQTLVRAGLRLVVESAADLEVVGEASDGNEALKLVAETIPDVVLMDIRMPGMDGIEATRRMTRTEAAPHVVILTTFDLDEYVFDALEAGATGFLLKHAPPEELLYGIRSAATGDGLLSPAVTRRLVAEFSARRPRVATDARLNRLTAREREILELVARGMNNSEIAAHLHVGESTVKTHIAHALTKLELRDRVHAVIYAYEHGLLTAWPSQTSSSG
ncbi:MAG: response regulator transcription factor [Actinomycetota bacterium]|nr:response regulator transcription factor [Actinomycetota bacterium]